MRAYVGMTLLDASSKSQSWQERATEAGAAALLGAAVAALAGAWLTPGRVASWPAAGGVAAAYVVAVLAVAAAIGWWRLALPERQQTREVRKLLASVMAVAAWLAPAAIFGARGAWMALPVAAVLGVLSAKTFAAADIGRQPPENVEMPAAEMLWVLAFSPVDTRRRIDAQVAVAAAYIGAVLALLGWIAAAAALTGIACAILAGLASRPEGGKPERSPAAGSAVGIGLAILVTATAFLPGAGGSPRLRGPEGDAAAPAQRLRYSSVILLADPPPEPALKAPPLLGSRGPGRTGVSAFRIPFSGEYWYYFWPLSRPSRDALRKYGSPFSLAYTWIDQGRLVVQARQPLAEVIDFRCCSGIDVVLQGREERPGIAHVELALRSAPGAKPVSLGLQSLPELISRRVTLSFAMPQESLIRSFDQIVVFFHLEPDLRRSPNLAIERFDLVP